MTNNEMEEKELCPQCGSTMPVNTGFVTWCEECDWNVQPLEDQTSDSLIASIYLRLNRRMSESLFTQMAKTPRSSPRVSLSTVLAFGIAGVVHLVSVTFLLVGVYLLLAGWPSIISIIISVFLMLLAWGARPRFPKEPKNLVPRGQCPRLYELLDQITDELGGKQIHGLVVEPQFNATFFNAGWRRKPIISLGLPLLSILGHQEKVALLAHELAHEVNGDPLRRWLIGSAVNTIAFWSTVILPNEIWRSQVGSLLDLLVSVLMIPANIALLGLSKLLELLAYGLLFLVFRESQRAEYTADYLASTISGTKAAVNALSKLLLSQCITVPIQRHALTGSKESIFEKINEYLATVPERELERIKRVNTLEGARIDVTHPPTVHRIEYLSKHEIRDPKIVLSESNAENIQLELQYFEAQVQKKLTDAYVSGLYS